MSIDKIKGDLRYSDAKKLLTNGSGPGKVDLLHFDRYTLDNAVKLFNLDGGIVNVWGDQLDFDAIKYLLIFNPAFS